MSSDVSKLWNATRKLAVALPLSLIYLILFVGVQTQRNLDVQPLLEWKQRKFWLRLRWRDEG